MVKRLGDRGGGKGGLVFVVLCFQVEEERDKGWILFTAKSNVLLHLLSTIRSSDEHYVGWSAISQWEWVTDSLQINTFDCIVRTSDIIG